VARPTTVPAHGRHGNRRFRRRPSSTPAPDRRPRRDGELRVPALPKISERTLGELLSGASLSMDDISALLDDE
jgi:hypothetical protein